MISDRQRCRAEPSPSELQQPLFRRSLTLTLMLMIAALGTAAGSDRGGRRLRRSDERDTFVTPSASQVKKGRVRCVSLRYADAALDQSKHRSGYSVTADVDSDRSEHPFSIREVGECTGMQLASGRQSRGSADGLLILSDQARSER